MMAPPTGGAGIAFNKGKNVSTIGTPSATGAGTGMTGGAKIVGGAKIKQQINLEGVTKDVIEENKLNVERALASSLGLDIGAVQITSVDESTAAAQPTEQSRRRLLAEADATVIQYVAVVTENQRVETMNKMVDTESLAISLASKLKLDGTTIEAKQIKIQQPIAAKTKDADEDLSDGDLKEAKLDGNLEGVGIGPAIPCPNDCSGNGYCRNGKCECMQGFTGSDCRVGSCPGKCGATKKSHGKCDTLGEHFFECTCEPGFTGKDCSVTWCPNDCSGNGICLQEHGKHKCYCRAGWVAPPAT